MRDIRCDFRTVKTDNYRGEVLLGSWFEKRCKFVKNPHDFKTIYMVDYDPKPPMHGGNKEFVWEQVLRDQGYGARLIFDHQSPDFLENMSTTYDVAFRVLTKDLDGPNPRRFRGRMERYEPVQDYAQNYGSITNWGLREVYQKKWNGEKQDPRATYETSYTDGFRAPKDEDLKFERYTQSMANKKNRRECDKSPKCNLITWECTDKYKAVPDMCSEWDKPKKRLKKLKMHFYTAGI